LGERKRRREKFFAKNSHCCFCGGKSLAVEIDHQPPKIFFVEKSSPRELRFPSCQKCNRSSRALDLIFAFVSRFDPTGKFTEDYSEIDRMIRALHNNYPTTKPYFISDREKRRSLRNLDVLKPQGLLWRDVPMVGFNDNVGKIVDLSLAKLAVGLYYLYLKKIAPIGSKIVTIAERDILLKKPVQIDILGIKFEEFLLFKNPNKLAEQQLGISLSYNSREKFFGAKIRVNQSILSTVAIFDSESSQTEELSADYIISDQGFPWGIDLEDLLKGKPGDTYYVD